MTSRMRARAVVRQMVLLSGMLSMSPAASANETLTYGYDALGRLVKVARTGTVNNNSSECYAYDPASNRSNVTVSTTSDCAAPPVPTLSINNASGTEGSAVVFTVTRSGSTSGTDTVQYATGTTGTATSGSDYTPISPAQTLTFAPAVTTHTISVSTIQDSLVEGNETFFVNLSNPSTGATISDSQGQGTIVDDDTAPTCSGVIFSTANAGSVTEGGTLTFTVTKTGTATSSCSVNYATQDNTAVAGSDYTATSGTLTFAVADTSKTVAVQTIDDSVVENTESFNLNLSSPTGGATLGQSVGSGGILDNDSGNHPPVANPDSLTVTACGSGTVNVVANDTDQDGDAITLVSATGGTKGDATVASTTSVTYSAFAPSGTDTASYVIQDTHGATATGTINVTISGGQCNAPPP